jgi:Spy/CpxP family protein refolding chaperone
MFAHVALGILAGAALVRFVHRRHHGRGMSCHGGHRFGGWHRGGHKARHVFWLIRDLDLTRDQVRDLREVWHTAHEARAKLQYAKFEGVQELVTAATSEPLDKTALEETAARYVEAQTAGAKQIVNAVAKLHEVLTPDQRAKLRTHLTFFGFRNPPHEGPAPSGPGAGPYRV